MFSQVAVTPILIIYLPTGYSHHCNDSTFIARLVNGRGYITFSSDSCRFSQLITFVWMNITRVSQSVM